MRLILIVLLIVNSIQNPKKSDELRNNAFKMINEIDTLLEKADKINSDNTPKIPSYSDPEEKEKINESDIKELDLDDIGLDYDVDQKEKEE